MRKKDNIWTPVGHVFEYNGHHYKVMERTLPWHERKCAECSFSIHECNDCEQRCLGCVRPDGKDVVFVLMDDNDKSIQTFNTPRYIKPISHTMEIKEEKKITHRIGVIGKKSEKAKESLDRAANYIGFVKKQLMDGADPELYKLLCKMETDILISYHQIGEHIEKIQHHAEETYK